MRATRKRGSICSRCCTTSCTGWPSASCASTPPSPSARPRCCTRPTSTFRSANRPLFRSLRLPRVRRPRDAGTGHRLSARPSGAEARQRVRHHFTLDRPQGRADEDHKRQVEQLGEALKALERVDCRLAECVDLKFFCGLSLWRSQRIRNVSERTVQRDWQKARVLLSRFMTSDSASVALDE